MTSVRKENNDDDDDESSHRESDHNDDDDECSKFVRKQVKSGTDVSRNL